MAPFTIPQTAGHTSSLNVEGREEGFFRVRRPTQHQMMRITPHRQCKAEFWRRNVCARYPKAKAIADLSRPVPAFILTETIDDHESFAIMIRSSSKIQCGLRQLFPVRVMYGE